jgi:hypothetical protein
MDDEDRKPPARRSPPRGNDDDVPQHKRRRDDSSGAVIGGERDGGEEYGGGDIYDVADQLNFRPGDRFEVKWTILEHDDDDDAAMGGAAGVNAKESEGAAPANATVDDGGDDDDGSASGGITVWWEATLVKKTDRVHDLAADEEVSGIGGTTMTASTTTSVRMPIYELNYAPLKGEETPRFSLPDQSYIFISGTPLPSLFPHPPSSPEHGFDGHSVEDVAFISDTTLLNLSTDEVMKFRRAGMPSPPSSPERDVDVAEEHDDISREFNGEDDMMSFMNRMMQRVMKNTGMDQKIKGLPASQQLFMAERIRKAKEGMFDSIMEETNKMGTGEKIITEEVVRRCMEKMKGAY